MPNRLRSSRLILRPLLADDTEAIGQAAGTTDVTRIQTLVERSAIWWRDYGYGVWVILDPATEKTIGWCGLRPVPAPDSPELFYGLSPSARGKGLATEAGATVVDFVFTRYQVGSVWAATEYANEASFGVMTRIGMQQECRRVLDGVDSVIYRIQRPDPA